VIFCKIVFSLSYFFVFSRIQERYSVSGLPDWARVELVWYLIVTAPTKKIRCTI
jgi:hypothetical protein